MAIRISIVPHGVARLAGLVQRWARRSEGAVARTTGRLAHELRKDIVTGIKKQAPGGIRFVPLKAATIAAKGGKSKALIEHGDLIRSVNVTKIGKLVYFVGVHRSVPSRSGQPMVNIAEVHEFGSKKAHIPARPFLRPSYAAWRYGVERRFAEMVAKDIGVPMLGAMRGRVGSKMGGVSFGGGGD